MSARRDPPPEVLVRFVRTEVYEDAVLASRAREVLGADEGATLARLRPAAARRDYLAAHALARTMLAELAGSDPARLRFGCPPRGRPELVAPPAARHLHFSISHADGIGRAGRAPPLHLDRQGGRREGNGPRLPPASPAHRGPRGEQRSSGGVRRRGGRGGDPLETRVLAPDALPRSGGCRVRRILGPRCAPLRSRGALLSGYRRPRFMEPTRSPCRRCSGQGSPRP